MVLYHLPGKLSWAILASPPELQNSVHLTQLPTHGIASDSG
jgi:hypothetical protein